MNITIFLTKSRRIQKVSIVRIGKSFYVFHHATKISFQCSAVARNFMSTRGCSEFQEIPENTLKCPSKTLKATNLLSFYPFPSSSLEMHKNPPKCHETHKKHNGTPRKLPPAADCVKGTSSSSAPSQFTLSSFSK